MIIWKLLEYIITNNPTSDHDVIASMFNGLSCSSNYDAIASMFEEPSNTPHSDFITHYIEQGIHPVIVEYAYSSPIGFSDAEFDAFYKYARAYSESLNFTEQIYPFQHDSIIYHDLMEFKATEAYFYYTASQYP